MIHVDALDFSEWHSEEVISFFWRSVYIPIIIHKLTQQTTKLHYVHKFVFDIILLTTFQ